MQIDLPLQVLVFLIVGAAVSLDVTGLTVSKSKYFAQNPNRRTIWALSNGLWHAGLLAIYVFGIRWLLEDFLPWITSGVIAFFRLLASIFDFVTPEFIAALTEVARSVQKHSPILLGLIAVAFVWITYSKKITSEPSSGQLDELPPLARTVFNLLDIILRVLLPRTSEAGIVRFLYWQAQAALVAIDMLALAILLSSLDMVSDREPENAILVISLVFALVFVFAMFAGKVGAENYKSLEASKGEDAAAQLARDWVLLTLRFVEPLLIFYFALQLVAFLVFGRQIHSTTFIFSAALLVSALVKRHTLREIALKATIEPPSDDELASPRRTLAAVLFDILKDLGVLGKWIGYTIVAAVVFAAFISVRYDKFPDPFPFEAELSQLVAWIGYGLLIAFLPSPAIMGPLGRPLAYLEARIVAFSKILLANCYTFLLIFLAALATVLFPIYDDLLEKAPTLGKQLFALKLHELGFVENHFHALQIGIWLIWFTVVAMAVVVVDKSYPIAERDASSGGSDRGHFWRWFYAAIYGVGAFILDRVVVPLQLDLDKAIASFRIAIGQ